MKAIRSRTRKLLFQELYAMKFNKFDQKQFYESFYSWQFTFKIDKKYIKEIKEIIQKKEDIFTKIIQKYASKFDVNKMSPTYVLPIYISLAEIFFLKEEIPIKVSINEAVEIAKKYADDPGKKIVNAILNKIMENYDKLKKEIL
jgi:transcription antitermination protein NusB